MQGKSYNERKRANLPAGGLVRGKMGRKRG